jgi:iron complex transport system substrate-binding protein
MIKKVGPLLLLLLTFGCQNIPKSKATLPKEIEVQDFRGKTIGLSKPAERVICLIESALSGIYMLEGQQQVIGISTNVYEESLYGYYSQLDDRIAEQQLPAPGNWDLVSMEQILELKPDLVIIWTSQSETIQQLENFDIPVYGVMLVSFADVVKEIKDLGKLLGKEKRAEWLIDFTQQEINKLDSFPDKGHSSAYFVWPQGINHTSGKESTVNDLFKIAGFSNCCPLPDEHVSINIEHLLLWNPDLIVMWPNPHMDVADWEKHQQIKSLYAVRNQQVFELPHPFLCDLWTLKLVYAAHLINQWAYPTTASGLHDDFPDPFFNALYHTQIQWTDEEQ